MNKNTYIIKLHRNNEGKINIIVSTGTLDSSVPISEELQKEIIELLQPSTTQREKKTLTLDSYEEK